MVGDDEDALGVSCRNSLSRLRAQAPGEFRSVDTQSWISAPVVEGAKAFFGENIGLVASVLVWLTNEGEAAVGGSPSR